MREYSFNDFKYICYVEGKRKGVEKVDKKDIDLKTIYNEYLLQ